MSVIRTTPELRYQPAAALAAFGAFAVAAALDWVWELPAVGAVGIAALGLIAVWRSGADEREPRAETRAARVVAVTVGAVALVLFALATLDVAAQLRLDANERAADRRDGSASVTEAQAARALEPWSAVPLLRIALAEERFGSLGVARAAIELGVVKDPTDWRIRVVAARLEAKTGDIEAATRSLATARALNPRSPLFATRR
jgi:hypothetical protein